MQNLSEQRNTFDINCASYVWTFEPGQCEHRTVAVGNVIDLRLCIFSVQSIDRYLTS